MSYLIVILISVAVTLNLTFTILLYKILMVNSQCIQARLLVITFFYNVYIHILEHLLYLNIFLYNFM